MGFCTLWVFSDSILNRSLYGEEGKESNVMCFVGWDLVPKSYLDVFGCATASPVTDNDSLLFGLYMEQTRRETVGTWCFEVLSSMYSHVSGQVSQDALRMYLFALCITMFSR